MTNTAELNEFKNNDIGAVNTYAMYLRGQHIDDIDTGNTFSGGKDVYIAGLTNVDTQITWPALDVYYLFSGDIYIGSLTGEASLTLSPGIKMSGEINIGRTYVSSRASDVDAPGTIFAIGEPNNPIRIEKTDNISIAAVIQFYSQTGDLSKMSNCIIDGAGLSTLGVRITHLENETTNPYPEISNNTISNMISHPIQVSNAYPLIENNIYINNGTNEVQKF